MLIWATLPQKIEKKNSGKMIGGVAVKQSLKVKLMDILTYLCIQEPCRGFLAVMHCDSCVDFVAI